MKTRARSRSHALLEPLARDFPSAVVNARTDHNHPCEVLSDLQFVRPPRLSYQAKDCLLHTQNAILEFAVCP